MRKRRLMIVAGPLLLLLLLAGTGYVMFVGDPFGSAGTDRRGPRAGSGATGSATALDETDVDVDGEDGADDESGASDEADTTDETDDAAAGAAAGSGSTGSGDRPDTGDAARGPGVSVGDTGSSAGGGPTGGGGTVHRRDDTNQRRRPRVRRQSVPRELINAKPRKLEPFTGSVPLTDVLPDEGGLLGSYFDPQTNPQNGKLELAPPDQWSGFLQNFSRIDEVINFPDTASLQLGQPGDPAFMVLWDGFLNVVEPGTYAFFVGHTGDTRMFIDDQRVFRDNDSGIYLELFFTVVLEAGKHPVQITWFHKANNGSAQFRLRYYTPADMALLAAAENAPDTEQVHTVSEGDTPASLSTHYYGVASHADVIIDANEELVAADQPLEPGTQVIIPPLPVERIPDQPTVVPPGFLLPALDPSGIMPPTVDSIEPGHAEVGEIVEIRGRNFTSFLDQLIVTFGGQPAVVESADATTIRAMVPIGATSGAVIVRQGGHQSNAADFTVTNVFGLLARYYDLTGEAPGYVPDGSRSADDIHVTDRVTYSARVGVDAPAIRDHPFAIRYDGELGIPDTGTWRLVLRADEAARVLIDGLLVAEVLAGGEASADRYFERGRLPVVLEVVDAGGAAHLDLLLQRIDGVAPDDGPWSVPEQLFFPPEVASQPPQILEVSWSETWGEFGPAEGDTFAVTVAGIEHAHGITAFIDGIAAPTTPLPSAEEGGPDVPRGVAVIRVQVPVGVGEGELVVRYQYVPSNPYPLPIRNVGLMGTYYDFEEENLPGEGWPPGFPGDRPISLIRQDRVVDFEGPGQFDVPFVTETFGAIWTGTLRVTEPGQYRFWVGGDDGMSMRIGEFELLDSTIHYYKEIDGLVELQPGEYPIEVWFWENRRHEIIRIMWQPPGGEKHVIPSRNLRMPSDWMAKRQQWLNDLEAGPDEETSGEGEGEGEPTGE